MPTFRTTLIATGKNTTGIQVPEEIVSALGPGKRPAVNVTINGTFQYRTTVAPMGGAYWIPVSAERRDGAAIKAGDAIEVPQDFQAALEGDPAAKQFFDSLAYSHQLRHVLAITDAKTPETRQRRIDKALEMLREGRK